MPPEIDFRVSELFYDLDRILSKESFVYQKYGLGPIRVHKKKKHKNILQVLI
jgi:hypothetical protein